MLSRVLGAAFDFAPFWIPVFLGLVWWTLWRRYLTIDFIAKQTDWILLEIRIPQDVLKSPLAMEVVLTALNQGNPGNPYEKFFLGQITRWFSLEIVSRGGDVRFYIYTLPRYKNLIESRIYSQYPGAEIYEVPDYVHEVEYHGDGSPWNVWGVEFTLAKPDPYPIRTYLDYELDRLAFREEQEAAKVDPLVSLIESFSDIGKDEMMWMQIIIRASKKQFRKPGTWFGKQDWRGQAKDLIKVLREEGKADEVKALERSVSKVGFDCGIRAMYVAKSHAFNGGKTGGIRVALEPFNSSILNGFKRVGGTDNENPFANYFWELGLDPFEWKFRSVEHMKKIMLGAYRARAWFYPPYINERAPFVLNTEELATIYHFPGRVLQTPSFVRVNTKKSEPPVNLPT